MRPRAQRKMLFTCCANYARKLGCMVYGLT
jgi:hypothetical protein